MVARELADKVGGEIDEFFLPRNFKKHCTGCFTCFQTELSKCPHYKELEPLEKALQISSSWQVRFMYTMLPVR